MNADRMMQSAQVEQAGDGTWTAAVIGEHTVLGTGSTKQAALDDLRRGVDGLLEYLAHGKHDTPNVALD